MNSFEMDMKAREGVRKKMAEHFGYTEEEQEPKEKYSSYDEAQKARDVKSMLDYKFREREAKRKGSNVITLSKEYASTLSIAEIQKRIPHSKTLAEKAKALMDRIYNTELDKVTEHYQKTIGGLQGEEMARAKAMEAVDAWAMKNEGYLEARSAYEEVNREYTALKNAKEMYIEANMDLINAEKERARKEELLASGILEEMGLAPDKENS